MDRLIHGSTNIGLKFKDGIVLAYDSRTTDIYVDKSGKQLNKLMSDQDVKLFQLSTKPSIYCTLMGDVEQWHEMYRHLRGLELKSVKDAFDCAKAYLEQFRKKNQRAVVAYGTIIVGYNVKEGFQMLGVSLDTSVTPYDKPWIVIGSGSQYAVEVIASKGGYLAATMTEEDVVTMALRALMESSFQDPGTGGYLKVALLHEHGCLFDRYQLLDVYTRLYDPSDIYEQRSLLVIYSTTIGPIFTTQHILDLIGDLWSDELKIKHHNSNVIGKKSSFYVNRMLLKSAEDAAKVYEYLRKKNARPIFPANLAHIRSCLVDCIRKKTKDHIYIRRSSKQLLEGICKLNDAHTLKY